MTRVQFVRHNDFVKKYFDSSCPFEFQAVALRAVDNFGAKQGQWDREIVAIDAFGRIKQIKCSDGKLQESRDSNDTARFSFVTSIAMADDNRTLALTNSDGADSGVLWLWDIESNKSTRRVIVSGLHKLSGVVFFQDSIVTSGLDGAIRIWRLSELELLSEVCTGSAISHLVATRDILFTTTRHVISAWSIDNATKTLSRIKDIEAPFDVVAIDVSTDGRVVIAGSDNGTVCMINTESSRIVWSSKPHDAPVTDVRLTQRLHILSSSLDGLKVNHIKWDQETAILVDGRSEFGLCQGVIPFEVDPFERGDGVLYALYLVGSPTLENVEWHMGIVRLWFQVS